MSFMSIRYGIFQNQEEVQCFYEMYYYTANGGINVTPSSYGELVSTAFVRVLANSLTSMVMVPLLQKTFIMQEMQLPV